MLKYSCVALISCFKNMGVKIWQHDAYVLGSELPLVPYVRGLYAHYKETLLRVA